MPLTPDSRAPETGEPEDPALGRRLVALLIDWVLAMLIARIVFGVDTTKPAQNVWEASAALVIYVVMVTLLVGLLGFSIGKRLLGLRVINTSGRPIGIARALIRTALLVLILPAILMTDDKRGLHDLAAGSKEIRA